MQLRTCFVGGHLTMLRSGAWIMDCGHDPWPSWTDHGLACAVRWPSANMFMRHAEANCSLPIRDYHRTAGHDDLAECRSFTRRHGVLRKFFQEVEGSCTASLCVLLPSVKILLLSFVCCVQKWECVFRGDPSAIVLSLGRPSLRGKNVHACSVAKKKIVHRFIVVVSIRHHHLRYSFWIPQLLSELFDSPTWFGDELIMSICLMPMSEVPRSVL